MLEISGRQLRLLSLLQAGRDWTGNELAERLGVTARTVRSDIDRLRRLGYPVDARHGAPGGYRLRTRGAVPPLLFDDDEAVAVAVSLRAAATGSVVGIEETSVRALAKLQQVLPAPLRRRITALQASTNIAPSPNPHVDAEVLTVIARACHENERLRFEYRSHSGTERRRSVEPYRLMNHRGGWYLFAWDSDRGDWRTFGVDRVVPRIPTGPRFIPRTLPPEREIAAWDGQWDQ